MTILRDEIATKIIKMVLSGDILPVILMKAALWWRLLLMAMKFHGMSLGKWWSPTWDLTLKWSLLINQERSNVDEYQYV